MPNPSAEQPTNADSGRGTADDFDHTSVMLDEVLETLAPSPSGVFVDATLGAGGHTLALLQARPDMRAVGFDQDAAAIAAATRRLEPVGDRVQYCRARFDRLDEQLDALKIPDISAFLFDLGVSSPQLDHSDRGFSYRSDGPLDMRMDQSQERSADDVVNTYDARSLARVLRTYADERFADRIAKAIVAARPIASTTQLADIVRDAIPHAARRKGGHPAKRTFQALRIEVNNELEILGSAIDAAIERLTPGGRGVVLSYHSGEDRIVKERLQFAEDGGCTCPVQLPCGCQATRKAKRLARGARKASAAEIERNPRAESVRFRAIERTDTTVGVR